MWLLVGLGNPGPDHARHRHNVGFMAVDAITHRHDFAPFRKRFQGLVAEGQIGGEKIVALKPQTYMNLSGESVAAAARFYKLEPERMIVVYDEIDLVPGKLRVKRGGGSAGHNGLRSIDAHLGNDYWRIRIGIGHPGHADLVAGYVLHDFAKADRVWLEPLLEAVADAFPRMIAGDAPGFATRVALLLQPPKPKADKPAAKDQPKTDES